MSMSFQSAMQEAGELLGQLETAPALFDGNRLKELVSTQEGARGFFVVLLAGSFDIADEPPPVLIETIKQAPEDALIVLAKNLVMSAATEIAHRRNKDDENAAGSARVLARTQKLIKLAQTPALRNTVLGMRESMQNNSGAFAGFLARVNYDQTQISAGLQALEAVLAADQPECG